MADRRSPLASSLGRQCRLDVASRLLRHLVRVRFASASPHLPRTKTSELTGLGLLSTLCLDYCAARVVLEEVVNDVVALTTLPESRFDEGRRQPHRTAEALDLAVRDVPIGEKVAAPGQRHAVEPDGGEQRPAQG